MPLSTDPAANSLPLEDIITPSGVAIWPPAIGWWLVAFFVLGLLVFFIISYRRYQKKWGYRKDALSLLDNSISEWQRKKLSDEKVLKELINILKRTSISAYPLKKIESLYGNSWLTVLRSQAPQVEFPKDIVDYISGIQYQKKNQTDPVQLYAFCKDWIQLHDTQWHGIAKSDVRLDSVEVTEANTSGAKV